MNCTYAFSSDLFDGPRVRLPLTPIFIRPCCNLGFGDVVGLVVDNVQGAGGVGVEEINGAFENVTVGACDADGDLAPVAAADERFLDGWACGGVADVLGNGVHQVGDVLVTGGGGGQGVKIAKSGEVHDLEDGVDGTAQGRAAAASAGAADIRLRGGFRGRSGFVRQVGGSDDRLVCQGVDEGLAVRKPVFFVGTVLVWSQAFNAIIRRTERGWRHRTGGGRKACLKRELLGQVGAHRQSLQDPRGVAGVFAVEQTQHQVVSCPG